MDKLSLWGVCYCKSIVFILSVQFFLLLQYYFIVVQSVKHHAIAIGIECLGQFVNVEASC